MRTDEAHSPPFDEKAALEELERLRDAIEESRRRRSQRSDEFEAFIRSFRTGAAPADAHALQGELKIQRRVWVRVLLDGQRAVERELAAGTRIPLQADRAIVIRAGDAGALRLTINGVDRGPLGKDAEIITRTFTAPR